jgi:outer membrane biogenesis lipoprotein LolB
MRPLLALAVCALLAAGAAAAAEQANTTNKFRQREASDDMLGYPHL